MIIPGRCCRRFPNIDLLLRGVEYKMIKLWWYTPLPKVNKNTTKVYPQLGGPKPYINAISIVRKLLFVVTPGPWWKCTIRIINGRLWQTRSWVKVLRCVYIYICYRYVIFIIEPVFRYMGYEISGPGNWNGTAFDMNPNVEFSRHLWVETLSQVFFACRVNITNITFTNKKSIPADPVFRNIGYAMFDPVTSKCSSPPPPPLCHSLTQKPFSRTCLLFGVWMNHLPTVCWTTFRLCVPRQLLCKFDILKTNFYWRFAFILVFINYPNFTYYFSSYMNLLWHSFLMTRTLCLYFLVFCWKTKPQSDQGYGRVIKSHCFMSIHSYFS